MKINDVLVKEKENKSFVIEGLDGIWTVVCRVDSIKWGFSLVNEEGESLTKKFVTSNILEMEFKEVVNWSTVEIDTPIYVKHYETLDWIPRHFAKYENCKVYAWIDGQTSHSVNDNTEIFEWKYAKL